MPGWQEVTRLLTHKEKMENQYETVFVINSLMSDDEISVKIEKFGDIIKKNGGTIVHSEVWGRRRLAYQIKTFSRGYFHMFYYKGTGKTVSELNLNSGYDEDVLRCFTTKVDDITNAYNEFTTLKGDPMINLNNFNEVLSGGKAQ